MKNSVQSAVVGGKVITRRGRDTVFVTMLVRYQLQDRCHFFKGSYHRSSTICIRSAVLGIPTGCSKLSWKIRPACNVVNWLLFIRHQ